MLFSVKEPQQIIVVSVDSSFVKSLCQSINPREELKESWGCTRTRSEVDRQFALPVRRFTAFVFFDAKFSEQ